MLLSRPPAHVALALLICAPSAYAQNDTIHAERFALHAQATIVEQYKPKWEAPYSGANSLTTEEEDRTSMTGTLYASVRLWKDASFVVDPEIAGGSGLSAALGVGDAPNGETFRVGDPAPNIYLARAYLRQVFALGGERTWQATDQNKLAGLVPTHYLALTAGKVSVADYFDANSYAHDPRTQFLAWSLMSNGAWDYPANVRGYTPGVIMEYVTPRQEVRAGLALLPTEANGNEMDFDIGRSNGLMVEYTRSWKCHGRKGAARVLGFRNTTHMGGYAAALELPLGLDGPDITAARAYGRTKYGITFNAEQEVNGWLGVFARAGWNDGLNETWVFTEIDRTVSAGLGADGKRWHREGDHAGLAFVASGLSREHAQYLSAGGRGFMLGDGGLTNAWEKLTEVYYSAALVPDRLWITGTYQLLMDPGYNSDRSGPVHIFSVRVHWVV